MNRIFFYAKSIVGDKRENNEDYYKIPEESDQKMGNLFVICDGVGGYFGGEIASKYSAESFFKKYYELNDFPDEAFKILKKNLEEVQAEILEKQKSSEFMLMSTTLTALLIKDQEAFSISIGDSRLYIYRNGALIQITEDHSPVWQRYKSGKIKKDEILKQPDKNKLTSALGFRRNFKISADKIVINENDFFLLCTDGLSDYLTDHEIESIIMREKQIPKQTVETLIKKAEDNGSLDNISVIAVKV